MFAIITDDLMQFTFLLLGLLLTICFVLPEMIIVVVLGLIVYGKSSVILLLFTTHHTAHDFTFNSFTLSTHSLFELLFHFQLFALCSFNSFNRLWCRSSGPYKSRSKKRSQYRIVASNHKSSRDNQWPLFNSCHALRIFLWSERTGPHRELVALHTFLQFYGAKWDDADQSDSLRLFLSSSCSRVRQKKWFFRHRVNRCRFKLQLRLAVFPGALFHYDDAAI